MLQQNILEGGSLSKLMQEIEQEAKASDQSLGSGLSSLVPGSTALQPSGTAYSSTLISIQARAEALAAKRVAALGLDGDSLASSPPPPSMPSPRFPGRNTASPAVQSLAESDDSRLLSPIENGGTITPSTTWRESAGLGGARQASSNSAARVDSPKGTSMVLSMVRREIEHLESRLTAQLVRCREASSAELQQSDKLQSVAMDRLEQKIGQYEVVQSKMDRKISELSGAVRGLSDEAQSQIRRSDMVDSRLHDFRHHLEEESRVKLAEIEKQMQEVASNCRISLSAGEDANRRVAQQMKRLEGHIQELGEANIANTSQTVAGLQERLDTLEAGYHMEAENTRAACEEMIASTSRTHSPRNESPETKDPRLWQFEHQLADLTSKMERIFQEAHGDRGWDARFQEHEVRLSSIRSKLDSQDALQLGADDRSRQDLEQRMDQMRKSVQDTASRQLESLERVDALGRASQVTDEAVDEIRNWLKELIRMDVMAQRNTLEVEVPVAASADGQHVHAMADSVQALVAQFHGQERSNLDTQRKVVKLESELRSIAQAVNERSLQPDGATRGTLPSDTHHKVEQMEIYLRSLDEKVGSVQAVSDSFLQSKQDETKLMDDARKLQEVFNGLRAMADQMETQHGSIQRHRERLENLESGAQAHRNELSRAGGIDVDSEPVAQQGGTLSFQVADLVLRMPSAEQLVHKTDMLAALAEKLGEVQKDTARHLSHLASSPRNSPRGPPERSEREDAARDAEFAARLAGTESTVSFVRQQLTEVWDALTELRSGGISEAIRPRASPPPLLEEGISSNVVASELGNLFNRVEEGEQECSMLQDQLKGRIATMDALLDRVAKEVLGPDGADVAAAVAAAVGAVDRISSDLPKGLRVCILGGTSWASPSNRKLVEVIARQIGAQLGGQIVVITTGLPGVQETFVQNLGVQVPVVNLASPGGSAYNIGQDIQGGDRMVLLGQLGDVYLTVEGGATEAKEAKATFARGAAMLPLICSGGSSEGMFDFPAEALQKPSFATEAQWAQLSQKGLPDRTAKAVVEMLQTLIMAQGRSD